MDDPFVRWSQIVRKPGTVILSGHHASELPALGDGIASQDARPATRLMVYPVATERPMHLIDITSTAAQAMLEGFLRSGVATNKFLSWSSRGFGQRRRDTIRIRSRLSE